MTHRLRFVLAALVAGGLTVPLAAQTSLPSAPQNVRGSVAGAQVTLAWDPPATGTPIVFYILDLGTQPGVYAASVPVGPIATLSFDGDIGATYYFRVSAVNFLGAGAPSAEVSVTVAAATQLPSAPLNPSPSLDGTEVGRSPRRMTPASPDPAIPVRTRRLVRRCMMLSKRRFEKEESNKLVLLPRIHYQTIEIFPRLEEKNSHGHEQRT